MKEKSQRTFLSNEPRFYKERCFLEGSQACPFVLVKAANVNLRLIYKKKEKWVYNIILRYIRVTTVVVESNKQAYYIFCVRVALVI
jgi:hypothetical protein